MTATRLLVCLAVAVLSGIAQRASAGFFMPAYSGNSQFINPNSAPTADGVVNFAVYRNDDGNWMDDFANVALTDIEELDEPPPSLGGQQVGQGIDSAAEYVYFYQIVNTDPNTDQEAELRQLQLFLPGQVGLVTSAGYLDGFAFNDAGSPTGPGSNARLGTLPNTTPSPDDDPGDGSPSENATPLGFSTVNGAVNPAYADEVGLNIIEFEFTQQIMTGAFSSVMFLTSFGAPIYHEERLYDGFDTSADIPIPNPEPSSVAMTLGVCLTGLGLLVAKKIRA